MNILIKTAFDGWYLNRNYGQKADLLYRVLSHGDQTKVEKRQELFMEAIEDETAVAFEKGFYTAVELLTRGVR